MGNHVHQILRGRALSTAAALALAGGALIFTGPVLAGAQTSIPASGQAQSAQPAQSFPVVPLPAGFKIGVEPASAPLLISAPPLVATPVHTYVVTTTADPASGTACPATTLDPCSLRTAVEQVNTDGTFDKVTVPTGTYLLEGGQLSVDDPGGVTIVGAGSSTTTIEADSTSASYPFRVFEVAGGTLAVTNATIEGGSSTTATEDGNGGGIEVSEGSLDLTKSTVTDNAAATDGGGIYVATGTQASFAHSTVSDNNSTDGAGIDDEGEVLATDLSVTGNVASDDAGGIVVSDTAEGAGLNGSGVTVSGNIAPDSGGGILNYFGIVALSNSTITGNGEVGATVTETAGGLGSEGIMTLTSVNVTHNTASELGAGILNAGQLAVTGGKIADNKPPSGDTSLDGGGLTNFYESTLTGVSVTGNQADVGAGVLIESEAGPASLTVSGGSISNNGAFPTDYGGGVAVAEATLSITGTTMVGDIGANGGAINAVEGATVSLTGVTLGGRGDPNDAESGGSLDIFEGAGAIITDSTVSYSEAEYGGGIDNTEGGAVTLDDSTVSDNSGEYGGGVETDDAITTVTGSTIAFNQASGYGGGLDDVGANLSMTNDTVAYNSTGSHSENGFGGGIDLDETSQATLDNVTVAHNTALGSGSAGGGFENADTSQLQAKGALLAYNTADGLDDNCDTTGGALFTSAGYNLSSDTSCDFTGPGDLNNMNPNLSPLASNGGPTQTEAVPSGSKAVKAEADCPPPTTDQRGVKRSKPCTIGAYQQS